MQVFFHIFSLLIALLLIKGSFASYNGEQFSEKKRCRLKMKKGATEKVF